MKLQLKRSNVLELGAAKEPTSAQMEYGELAVNYNDGDPALFIKDSADNIIRIGGAGSIGSGDTPSGPVPPSTGNEIGDIFFDTTLNSLVYWDGTSWVELSANENAAKIYVGTLAEINNDVIASTRRSGFLWWNTEDGTLYVWYEDGNTEQWVVAVPSGGSGGGGAAISSGPFLPNSGEENELFFNTTDGRLYIYYDDGSSQQWIDASPDNVPDLSQYVQKTGDTMTGDLTAPVIKATDHMEGVGEKHLVAFNTATEVEIAIPAWATRIELGIGQVVSAPDFPFEIVVKKGTGTDYGTVTSTNAFNSWVNDVAAVAVAGGAATYLRLFFNYFPGANYYNRGVGTIYLDDLGGGIHNMTAVATGIGHRAGSTAGSNAAITTYTATGFGNVDAKPTVLGFKCPVAGQDNRINVEFFA